ncbi:hybrid sensor histidine kinase/response regulator transcription factor [Gaetbulibacter saemankumensis]|uniref:hybrid sensor histidine kinase/response regulator transcription factor n=1 Tax=Gaetbulibacter saemankumensis TaxID=311208 RepID=UPI000481E4AB|nr:hybrid sensor histidine kinase/response regulator transcription factor [Gaetbulibacter saemankumensis]
MNRIRRYHIIIIILLFASNCFTQTQPVFKKIGPEHGLSYTRVTSIVKQQHGYVWIGTGNGLNKFDGKKIKVYNEQNSNLTSNNITDLLIDSKQRIWIATSGGLNLYNTLKDTFVTFQKGIESSFPSNEINTIFEDSHGNLWLGTNNGLSLYIEDENRFINYTHEINNEYSINNNIIKSIYEDVHGNLWVGTLGGGLNMFETDKKIFKKITSPADITSDFINVISGIDENRILIGTNGFGLLIFDITSLKFSKIELPSNQTIKIVRSIKKDITGNLWVGTDGSGLFNFKTIKPKDSQFIIYTFNAQLESSISSNSIYEVYEDENRNLWIGTAWDGVNVLSQNENYQLLYGTTINEVPSPVLSVLKDANLLIGLDGKGLSVLSGKGKVKKRYSKNHKKHIGADYIQYIKKGDDNTYWLGSFVNGLIHFNPATENFINYRYANNKKSLSYNDVRYIIEDEKHNLWIATWGGGLNYFNKSLQTFTHYKSNESDTLSLSSNNILSMQKDAELLWLGTNGGGVNVFNTKTKQVSKRFMYSKSNSNTISSNYVQSLFKDSKNNIWVGTSKGINLINKKTGQVNRFDQHKNIRHQTVLAIVEDNKHQIWFSTKQGIYNYNYDTNSFNSFENLAGEYHINAATKDENGFLYFGGAKGLMVFNPEKLAPKSVNPKVEFTSFKLYNKEVSIGENDILKNNISLTKSITLEHDMDVITFEFAAMQFPFSTNCEYAIQMVGFDKNWREIGHDVTATYTNLPHGNYIFKVKSKSSGSEWGDNFNSINIKIERPFWLTWWAYIIYFLITILIFYLFRKYIISWEQLKSNLEFERLSHEKDIELYNIKQQFFTNVSHELRTPITLITGIINKILREGESTSEKTPNHFKVLEKNSKHLLNLVNELLDFRKLESSEIKIKATEEDFVSFCKETFSVFQEQANAKNIAFTFDCHTSKIPLWFDKIQMDKVLYNLISNAFKFTNQNGSVTLQVVDTEDNVRLIVEDEGTGISSNKITKIFDRFYQTEIKNSINNKGYGLGLSIVKEIIELHHGTITVESEKDKGTKFTIELKKGNHHFNTIELGGKELNSEILENYYDVESHLNKEKDDALFEPGEKQKLLIVEDNQDIRDYIKEFLQDEFEILEAENGKIGLDIAKKEAPDLIISDVMMPEMNGIDLTRILKKDVDTSHIPIVLLTARASVMQQMEGYNTGADEYVTKPFNEDLLRSRIKSLLRNRAILHEKFRSADIVTISELAKNDADQAFLKNLIDLINENIDSDALNADFISKHLGMSHSVIYKKLKALTGLSLVEFIRDYKLKVAKKLLTEKGCTVAEACYHIGYSDRKYFSKLFKQQFGDNPSAFINRE